MKHIPIKLGPLALLLAVISICMTVLTILTFSTAQADLRLAQKYAETVQTQYEREMRGQSFLCAAEEAALTGADLPEGAELGEDGTLSTTIEGGTAALSITLEPLPDGSWQVVRWQSVPVWEENDRITGLWLGE